MYRMLEKGIHLDANANLFTNEGIESAINDAFNQHFASAGAEAGFRKFMLEEVKSRLLPDNAFTWLSKNDAACFYVLEYLNCHYSSSDEIDGEVSLYIKEWVNFHAIYNKYPASSRERFDTITEFFDRSKKTIDDKFHLLKHLQSEWSFYRFTYGRLQWIDKNDNDQCEWVWKYILDKFSLRIAAEIIITNNHERYMAICAVLLNLEEVRHTKKGRKEKKEAKVLLDRDEFIDMMHKVWKQRVYRDNIQKKASTTGLHLKKQTLSKLKKLEKSTQQSAEAMIESWIDKHYAKIRQTKE